MMSDPQHFGTYNIHILCILWRDVLDLRSNLDRTYRTIDCPKKQMCFLACMGYISLDQFCLNMIQEHI